MFKQYKNIYTKENYLSTMIFGVAFSAKHLKTHSSFGILKSKSVISAFKMESNLPISCQNPEGTGQQLASIDRYVFRTSSSIASNCDTEKLLPLTREGARTAILTISG